MSHPILITGAAGGTQGSTEEVTRLINSARNLFYRTILMTLYSTSVRRSELCCLKVTDMDNKRMMIRINQGKGKRDREVPLSPKLLEALRIYWCWMKPKIYLFPGTVHRRRVDLPITSNNVWLACREAAQAAGIDKRLHPHSLTPLPQTSASGDQSAPFAGNWQRCSCPTLSEAGEKMSRPPLEVADTVRAQGERFIDNNRHWIRTLPAKCCWRSHTVAPLCWPDIAINALVAAIVLSRITVAEITIVPSVRTALAINGSRLVVTSCYRSLVSTSFLPSPTNCLN